MTSPAPGERPAPNEPTSQQQAPRPLSRGSEEVPERVRAAFTALTASMLHFIGELADSDLLIDRNLGAAVAALTHAGMDVSARLSEVAGGR